MKMTNSLEGTASRTDRPTIPPRNLTPDDKPPTHPLPCALSLVSWLCLWISFLFSSSSQCSCCVPPRMLPASAYVQVESSTSRSVPPTRTAGQRPRALTKHATGRRPAARLGERSIPIWWRDRRIHRLPVNMTPRKLSVSGRGGRTNQRDRRGTLRPFFVSFVSFVRGEGTPSNREVIHSDS